MNGETRSVAYGESWIEALAAVEYLSRTHIPGLTVWDAVAEAVRWWVDGAGAPGDSSREFRRLPWHDPDPLRSALQSLLAVASPAGTPDGQDLRAVMDGALRSWLGAMAAAFNDDRGFATSWAAHSG